MSNVPQASTWNLEPYTFRGYTTEDLEAAFELVATPGDWKGAINALIAPDQQDVVEAAVIFYTATTPTFSPIPVAVRVDSTPQPDPEHKIQITAIGYRMGPAGP